MHIAFLLTGTNLGDRLEHIRRAEKLVEEKCGLVLHRSAVFETAAWGKEDQPAFFNQALCVETVLSARELLAAILEIEKQMGRVRGERYGERIIDIDILFFDDAVIDEPGLHVPHPQLHRRRFALVCMNDIAPDLVHPSFQHSITEILDQCEDPLQVRKLNQEAR